MEQKISVVLDYLIAGLEKNEKCLALLDDMSISALVDGFASAGVDAGKETASGRLLILNSWDTYLHNGLFDPERMIGFWKGQLDRAVSEGFSSLRVTGEVSWAFGKKEILDNLLEYERRLKGLFNDFPVTALCLYERGALTKEALLEALSSHRLIILDGSVRENPFFETYPGIMDVLSKKREFDGFLNGLVGFEDLERNKKSFEAYFAEDFMDLVPGVFYRLSGQGGLEFVNKYVERLTGYSPDDLYSGRVSFHGLVHPEDLCLLRSSIEDGIEQVQPLKYRIIRSDGRIAWVHDIRRVRQADGASYVDGVLFDVTAQEEARRDLEQSESSFKALAENANDGILIAVEQDRHVFANRRASEITGYSIEELLGMGIKDLAHPQDLPFLLERFSRRLKGETLPNQYETRIVRKDGKTVFIELTGARTLWHGNPAALVVIRDIMERKRAEEEIYLVHEITRAVAEATDFNTALKTAITHIGKAAGCCLAEAWLLKKDDTLERVETWHDGEAGAKKLAGMEGVKFKSGSGLPGKAVAFKCPVWIRDVLHDEGFTRREGEMGARLGSGIGVPVLSGGKVIAVLTFFMGDVREEDERFLDLISWVANQLGSVMGRKMAEDELKQSEARFRTLVEQLPPSNWVYLAALDGIASTIYVSPQAGAMGFTQEEWIREHDLWSRLIHPDDLQRVLEEFRNSISTGQPLKCEYRLLDRSGNVHWMRDQAVIARNDAGEPLFFQGLMVDVTERRLAEEALRASEARFKALVETTSDWVWEVDSSGAYTYASPRVRHLLGYEPEEVLGKKPFDFMPPGEAERVAARFARIVESKLPFFLLENANICKDGRVVILETSGMPIIDGEGNLAGYRGIDRDVTERKRAEEALRESERSLKKAQQIARMGSWHWDIVRDEIYTSDEFHSILGLAPGEDCSSLEACMARVHPDDRGHVTALIRKAMEECAPFRNEHRIVRPDGTVRIVNCEGEVTRDASGRASDLYGLVLDVTERRRAEEELREAERKFKLVIENGPDMVVMSDMATRKIIYANPAMTGLMGYSQEEIAGKTFVDITDPSQHGEQAALIEKFLREGSVRVHDRRWRAKDGRCLRVDLHLFMIRLSGREVGVGMARDMTAYMEALEQIGTLDRLYKTIAFSIPSLVILHDPELRIVFINDRFIDFTGFRKEDVLNKTPFDIFPPEFIEQLGFREKLFTVRDRKTMWGPEDISCAGRNGEPLTFRHSIFPIMDSEDHLAYVMAVLDDITEQKKSEAAILSKTVELDQLNQELNRLMVEVTRIEENDRKKFAELLHEGIGQNLAALKMGLEGIARKHKRSRASADAMEQLKPLLDDTIKVTRGMTIDLYPAPMTETGLKGAIEWYLDTIVRPKGIRADLDMDRGIEDAFREARDRQVLFRIMRESLQNALKHSGAGKIRISCTSDGNKFALCIRDDGNGFDYEKIRKTPGQGLGLLLLAEWARSLNGELTVKSAPGEGTEIKVEFQRERSTDDG